jgi:uncharacterized protein YnzC (UPF0291/DUF896 family)
MPVPGRVVARPISKVKPSVIKTVKPKMPLPLWRDFLGAPNPKVRWGWKEYWAKKSVGQKKLLLQDKNIRQLKAAVREDYKDKVKSYVRQAYAEGFIVIDSSGNPVTLSNLHFSNRDLV